MHSDELYHGAIHRAVMAEEERKRLHGRQVIVLQITAPGNLGLIDALLKEYQLDSKATYVNDVAVVTIKDTLWSLLGRLGDLAREGQVTDVRIASGIERTP